MRGMDRMLCAAVCCVAACCALASPENAIMRLLNSKASGSVRGYAEAAEEVAEAAAEGRPVYAFVLALVSQMPSPPPAARLDEATRKQYLDGCRDKIKKLAYEKNNSMAWYLLSLEANDRDLLHRAADAGNVQAQNAWGTYLVTRAIGETSDTNEVSRLLGIAHDYFKKAAGQNDPNGLYNLGMCHLRGLGTPRDDQSAFNCFRSAAEKGHPEAINNIGLFFREGRVVDKDLELSTKWFEKSASYENPFGQFNFALALQRGEGVKQDDVRAAEMLKKASDGGCVEAIDAYGVALWKGRGVKEDPVTAYRLFKRAAEAGYPPAMENLSTCYRLGKGVRADEKLSMEWKIRSRAVRGDRNAQAWIEQNARRK